MARVMKPPTNWDENDTDTGFQGYDGPPPVPGAYVGKVRQMWQYEVERDGQKQTRFLVLCEITEGKFKGASVTKWLQLTESGRPWLHQFLHSLTDGSEAQKQAVRTAFKNLGWTLGDPDQKGRVPVLKIGKQKLEGLPCAFVTKMRNDDNTRAEISRFINRTGGDAEPEGEDSDGLDEFASDTTENPAPSGAEADTGPDLDDGDDGDPWSV